MHKIQRALLSVSNKEGLVSLARFLLSQNVTLIATGGTAQKLTEAGLAYVPIEQITGNSEAFGGRMKTLSFPFLSALLFRRDNPEDVASAIALKIEPIDLVVCNFYPFLEAQRNGVADAELIEKIDIGGPSMVRAAAKNFSHVCVVTDPSQYPRLVEEMELNQGATSLELRRRFAVSAFALSAEYEVAISEELSQRFTGQQTKYLRLTKGEVLRYGENPHQKAHFYHLQGADSGTIAGSKFLQGKALSYNNILDADAAHRAASDVWFLQNGKGCAVSLVKHLNPCGMAWAEHPLEALELAWAGDPVSAFGGILCFSAAVDVSIARWLEDKFVELILAPSFSEEAVKIFSRKRNLRLLVTEPKRPTRELMVRSVSGGMLLQEEDEGLDTEFRLVTKQELPDSFKLAARFGLVAAKHLRSNAIALSRSVGNSLQLAGAGMGQPNRIDSLRLLAGPRAKALLSDCVLVSDAFFPFPDIIDVASDLGLRHLVQPGGSIKDPEVIAACDKLGISMTFTGRRHFRH